MKKNLLWLPALALLAACADTATTQQSRPAATVAPARTLRFDTTFVAAPTARTYRHSYTATLPLGRSGKAGLPIEIEWTTTQAGGCAQVVGLRVYQLGRADSAATLRALARRDARCRPGLLPPGTRPAGAGSPGTYTGLVLLRLTGVSRRARTFAETSLTLNGLGYHDTLDGRDATAAVRRPR